jgi:predicted oxidoreductase (fatty acid repression mutant protein)
LGLLSPPNPSFSGIDKVKDILLNLSMKWRNSAFNAQGSRLIIIIVQVVGATFNAQGSRLIIVIVQVVGAVKIYVAAVEALRKRKDRMKLSVPPKLMVF